MTKSRSLSDVAIGKNSTFEDEMIGIILKKFPQLSSPDSSTPLASDPQIYAEFISGIYDELKLIELCTKFQKRRNF